jgi:hypothetical protein
MAGLRGPVLSEWPPQLKGVVPVAPGSRAEGDVSEATLGSLVPPGVSTVPPPPSPKDCSNGFGSRWWLLEK